MPTWLTVTAVLSLALAGLCSLIILSYLLSGHPQHMWIMNVVWPITALYAGPLALYAYFRVGRLSTRQRVMAAQHKHEEPPGKQKPFWQMAGLAATHCGSGCTLGDIIAEWCIYFVPFTLFGKPIFGAWVLDYALALLFGLAFQYFTITPMRQLSVAEGLKQAVKADIFSLTSWQLGMYGWMALATFVVFGRELEKTNPVFWFMMQLAMLCGFLTSYPVNWLLLKKGVKEKM